MTVTLRDDVYRAYWQLAAERQRIFFRRVGGSRPPWTEDPVLGGFRFCNAYRASDRVSQYLIRQVIYTGEPMTPDDQLLRIVLFRLFSRPATWQLLEGHEPVRAHGFDPARLAGLLDRQLAAGETIYTSAFILAPTRRFGDVRKHESHLRLAALMLADGLGRRMGAVRSLSELYELLLGYPMIGPFMAYQLAIDINYSELVDFDESSFTVPGPGALRGIRKVFADGGGKTPAQLIHWMTDNQEAELARLGISMPTLWGRRLQAIDCQNLFCEVDKYARIRFPELRSERVRIKQRFNPHGPPPTPFYPPKWGINEHAAPPVGDSA